MEDLEFNEYSKTAHVIEDNIGQVLNEPNSLKSTDLSSFLYENLNLLSYMLIGYLLLFFFSYIFAKKFIHFLSPLKKSKLILSKLFYDDSTQLRAFSPEIALVFVFFNFFFFLLITLLINFIKTDAVIVNTNEIIDSNEKLLTTNKTLVVDNLDLEYFASLPKNNILSKLVKRKKENNQYLTVIDMEKLKEIIKKFKSSSFFILNSKDKVFEYLLICAAFIKNPIIFRKPTNYHETVYMYEMRKNLQNNKKKFIHQW